MPEHHTPITAAVIGGGWCGLIATKYLKESGLDCICFESTDSLGGIWKQAQDLGSTASASKSYLNSSDFMFDEDTSMFPTADEVMLHIHGYAKRFDLLPHIQWNSTVSHVEYDDSIQKWILSVTAVSPEGLRHTKNQVDKLVIATGLNGRPFIPSISETLFSTVPHVHSSELKVECIPDWCTSDAGEDEGDSSNDKSCILVVGGGESAADCASFLARNLQGEGKVVLSLRSGRWFLPKMKPPRNIIPADLASRRTFKLMSYKWFQRRFDHYLLSILGIGCHRVEAWKPPDGVTSWGCFLNKRCDQVLPFVQKNKILPVAGIRSSMPCRKGGGVQVEFECGTVCRVRGVIWATGYCFESGDIIPESLASVPADSILHIFPGNNPKTYGKIAYVGAARPNLGAIPSLAEYASFWVARVFSGNATLPPRQSVSQLVTKQNKVRLQKFPGDGTKIPTLVHSVEYTDAILRHLGMMFPVKLLPPINIFWTYPFLTALKMYWTLFSAPWSNLELTVLFNKDGRGLQTFHTIRRCNATRKKDDPDVFLKTFARDTLNKFWHDGSTRLCLLALVLFTGSYTGCRYHYLLQD